MAVHADRAERQLVHDGLAAEVRASLQQTLNGGSVTVGRCVGPQPVRVARARHVAGNVEVVLGGEAETSQRAVRGALDLDARSRTERAERVGYVCGVPHVGRVPR